jgi:hypothetical protein
MPRMPRIQDLASPRNMGVMLPLCITNAVHIKALATSACRVQAMNQRQPISTHRRQCHWRSLTSSARHGSADCSSTTTAGPLDWRPHYLGPVVKQLPARLDRSGADLAANSRSTISTATLPSVPFGVNYDGGILAISQVVPTICGSHTSCAGRRRLKSDRRNLFRRPVSTLL